MAQKYSEAATPNMIYLRGKDDFCQSFDVVVWERLIDEDVIGFRKGESGNGRAGESGIVRE